jgi:hypothetical protein
MMRIEILLPDDLVEYVDRHVNDRNQLIESLLQRWRKQRERQMLVEAALALDEEVDFEFQTEWEQAAILDYWESEKSESIE